MDLLAIVIICIFATIVVVSVLLFATIVRRSTRLKAQAAAESAAKLANYARKMADPLSVSTDELLELYRKAASDKKKTTLLGAVVEQWKGEFGDEGRVIVHKNDHEIEWRGRVGGHHARARFDPPALELHLKHTSPLEFELSWDPKKVEANEADAVWDEQDETRVFVGEHVFIRGATEDIEDLLRPFLAYAPELRLRAVELMGQRRYAELSAEDGALTIKLDAPFKQMAAIVERVRDGLTLLAAFADATGEIAAHIDLKTIQVRRVSCEYCPTHYVEQGEGCPGCGAPSPALA